MDLLTPRRVRRLIDATLVLVVGVVAVVALVSVGGPLIGLRPLIIRGSSMEPTVPRGSLVLAAEETSPAFVAGDVVSFREPNGVVVTHRIVAIEGVGSREILTTRGDANPAADPVGLPVTRVIGRVVVTLPVLGFVAAMLTMPVGLLCIVLLAAGLFVLAALAAELDADPCPVCEARRAERSVA
jgi:signal peptidase